MVDSFFRCVFALTLSGLAFSMTSCAAGVTYTPIFGLVSFRVSTEGISVQASSPNWETPIGIFTVDLSTTLSGASNQQTPDNGLLLTIRYYRQGTLVDEVYQINTAGSKVTVTADGHITFTVDQRHVFIDASKGNIELIEVKNVEAPHLKTLYIGTSNCTNCDGAYAIELHINSQQKGLKATLINKRNNHIYTDSCTGAIIVSGSITLHCGSGDNIFVFRGNVYSDGHIEGTETFPEGTVYQDTLK